MASNALRCWCPAGYTQARVLGAESNVPGLMVAERCAEMIGAAG